jgi:hypothetical protein
MRSGDSLPLVLPVPLPALFIGSGLAKSGGNFGTASLGGVGGEGRAPRLDFDLGRIGIRDGRGAE